MKRIHLATLVAILGFATLASAQTKPAAGPSVEEELKKLDHKWLDSERLLDVDYCEKFFADSYILVFPNGQPYTKKEWLGILRGPDHPTITMLDPEDIQVHVFETWQFSPITRRLKGTTARGTAWMANSTCSA